MLSSPVNRAFYDASLHARAAASRGQNTTKPGGATGQPPPGSQQTYYHYQRAQHTTHNSGHQTNKRSHANRKDDKFSSGGEVSDTIAVCLFVFFLLGGPAYILGATESPERLFPQMRTSDDPAQLRRIAFELAPRWMREQSPRPMMLLGDLASLPSDPSAIEARVWMRRHVDSTYQGRELVWIGVDMDPRDVGLTTRQILDGFKPSDVPTRFKSVLERCRAAIGALKSSGKLKEDKTLTVIALRETYLMCEYDSESGCFEVSSCGEWIKEIQKGKLGWSERGRGRGLIFSSLWKSGNSREV